MPPSVTFIAYDTNQRCFFSPFLYFKVFLFFNYSELFLYFLKSPLLREPHGQVGNQSSWTHLWA